MAGRLVLDRQHMIALLGDPDFFEQCPAFLWLRTTALQTKGLYDQSAARKCCGGDWAIMRPVVDAFFKNLKELQEADPANIQPVKTFLETKKGREYGKIVIYYRATKQQPHPLRFTF